MTGYQLSGRMASRLIMTTLVVVMVSVAAMTQAHAGVKIAELRPGTTQKAIPKERASEIPTRSSKGTPGSLRNLCSGHAVEYGDWINTDANTPGIAQIWLRDCQRVTKCSGDVCTTVYDAGWAMRVFGSCSPSNCDWGWSAGEFRLSSGHIYGYYDQGFAKRYVYAMMSKYRPGQLWVYWRTDFVDPNRADYERQEWFRRA
ncbi:MAG: hypothetical protein QOF52_2679 [Propionibacteriaceae bacterium]|nr:hypothetical protein [Propionibacteriaceae bacterium]